MPCAQLRSAPRPWARLLLALAAGCQHTVCATEVSRVEQSWCFAEASVAAAEDGELNGMVEAIQQIPDELVRAAAVEWALSTGPPNLDRNQAVALCQELNGQRLGACLATWDREYLWQRR